VSTDNKESNVKKILTKVWAAALLALSVAVPAQAQVWTTPRTWTTGELVTASMLNVHIRDNLTHLYNSQASVAGFFRGVVLRTNVDSDLAKRSVMLLNADQITMDDGTGVSNWGSTISCDVTVSGAGGLDTGSEGASRWYQIYAIRKSSDGTKNCLLHRSHEYFEDEVNIAAPTGSTNLRETSSLQKIAQGFQTDETSVPLTEVATILLKVGSPTGSVWMTIEADASGSPSGVALATSQKVDASQFSTTGSAVVFVFRNPYTVTSATQYHMVLNSDVTVNASNYVRAQGHNTDTYASRGAVKTYNGSAWAAGTGDLIFDIVVKRLDTAVTMPSGYDQKALIGWVRNNSSSDFVPFIAADNIVTPLTQQVVGSALTDTTPQTMNVATYTPPTTCKSWWWTYLEVATGARNITIGPAESAYIASFNAREGGQARMLVTVVGNQVLGPIINNSNWALYKTSGDSITIIIDSWEWQ
jgi:hypothetical protein